VRYTNQVERWKAGLQISVMDTKIVRRLLYTRKGRIMVDNRTL
jgi:hypothetical protein